MRQDIGNKDSLGSIMEISRLLALVMRPAGIIRHQDKIPPSLVSQLSGSGYVISAPFTFAQAVRA